MAAKHPSNKTTVLNPQKFHLTTKKTGKSNNQLSPHKRWRQSYQILYPKVQKQVAVEYYWYDNEGIESSAGHLVPYKDFIKHKKLYTNNPEFMQASIINKETSDSLQKELYKIRQGITLAYQLV